MPDHLAAARAYLETVHKGDARHALWTSRRRGLVPEALPFEFIRKQTGIVSCIAASSDDTGVHVLDSDGAVHTVPWDSIIQPQPKEQP